MTDSAVAVFMEDKAVDIYFTAVGMINPTTENEISEIMKEMQK